MSDKGQKAAIITGGSQGIGASDALGPPRRRRDDRRPAGQPWPGPDLAARDGTAYQDGERR